MPLDSDNLLLLCQGTGFSKGKYGCDVVVFPVEYFNGCLQLSQWDLTLLEQRLVTTHLIWMNLLPKSTWEELTGWTLVTGTLCHV